VLTPSHSALYTIKVVPWFSSVRTTFFDLERGGKPF
jgi:hypothetical protein